MFYTYLSKQWHKFSLEIWHDFFMLHKYPSLSSGELPADLCIEIVRPIYDKEKGKEQKQLELRIEKAEEESSHYFGAWQALGDEYESEYRVKESDLAELREELVSIRADDVLTNPDSAYKFLTIWHQGSLLTEKEALAQITEWFEIIKDVSPDLANSFAKILQRFCETNNLRYIFKLNKDNLEITFNPAFITSERFLTVKETHCDDLHLKSIYNDFESCFGDLFRNQNSTQVKNAIGRSSNLVEALANKSTGQTGKTLSNVVNSYLLTDCFPHLAAKDTLSKLYSFFSDYPGIRHAGTATSATRELSERDAFLYGSLSVLFADYLSRSECPICGNDMSIKDDGSSKFWECVRWPTCSGSKPLN